MWIDECEDYLAKKFLRRVEKKERVKDNDM
jgi:hypothetical protein